MTRSRRHVNSPESARATPAAIWRKVDLPEPLRPTSPICSPSVKAIVAPSRTTWAPYLTERLFALAMTAADVSAMGTSKVERTTRLRKVTARHGILESADVEFETRSFPNLLVATLATLPSMSVIPSSPFAPSILSALAENSLFSMRRFVALLELGELLLRAGDVRLVRAAELKELPLPTKVQLSGVKLRLVIFRFR